MFLDIFRKLRKTTDKAAAAADGFPEISEMDMTYTVEKYIPPAADIPHISLTEKQAQAAGYSYRKKSRNKIKITRYRGNETGVLVIPEQIGGMTVNEIGDSAFEKGSYRELYIPGTVKKMGKEAFWYSAAERLVIGEGVTEISYFAFARCTKLSSVSLPSTLVRIGPGAFNSCESLTSIAIPARCRYIGDCAFYGTGLSHLYAADPGVLDNGDALRNSALVKRYSMILASEHRLLRAGDNADVKISADGLEICSKALYNFSGLMVKRIDLSECTDIRFDFTRDGCYLSSRKTELVMPDGYEDRYFPPYIDAVHPDGSPYGVYYKPVISDDGRRMTFGTLSDGIPHNTLDAGNASEIVFQDYVGIVRDSGIRGKCLRSVYFRKGMPRADERLFGYSPELHEMSFDENGEKLTVYLPPTELVGWYVHNVLKDALCPGHNSKGKLPVRTLYMKLLTSDHLDLGSFGVWKGMHRITVARKVFIAIDALRSSEAFFAEDRAVYARYLRSHRRYARMLCAALPDEWHEYGAFLDSILR